MTFPFPFRPSFGAGLVETLVDRTSGTNFGDMTNTGPGGGIAAAFDGTTSQAVGSCAFKLGATGYVGKTRSPGFIMSRVVVHGSSGDGYITGGNTSITITLYGKNGLPSSGTDGTPIGSITFTDTSNESVGREITSTDQVNTYSHVWVYLNGASNLALAELVMYELS